MHTYVHVCIRIKLFPIDYTQYHLRCPYYSCNNCYLILYGWYRACCSVAIAMLKQAAAGDQFAVDQLKELNKQRSRKAELDESLKREVEEILRLRQVNTLC